MGKNKVIGFFGGTFDPLHLGHIQLALALKEAKRLDAVFFCPAALSPAKQEDHPMASPLDRLEMVRRALQPIENFQLVEEEIHRHEVSYTIDTLRALIKKYPHTQFRLLLGQDHLSTLTTWKEWHDLLKIAPPLVGARSSSALNNPLKLEVVDTPLFDISASEIRLRLKRGLYVGHLLPASVLDYIHEKKLYL